MLSGRFSFLPCPSSGGAGGGGGGPARSWPRPWRSCGGGGDRGGGGGDLALGGGDLGGGGGDLGVGGGDLTPLDLVGEDAFFAGLFRFAAFGDFVFSGATREAPATWQLGSAVVVNKGDWGLSHISRTYEKPQTKKLLPYIATFFVHLQFNLKTEMEVED